jgi:hypothetical protein
MNASAQAPSAPTHTEPRAARLLGGTPEGRRAAEAGAHHLDPQPLQAQAVALLLRRCSGRHRRHRRRRRRRRERDHPPCTWCQTATRSCGTHRCSVCGLERKLSPARSSSGGGNAGSARGAGGGGSRRGACGAATAPGRGARRRRGVHLEAEAVAGPALWQRSVEDGGCRSATNFGLIQSQRLMETSASQKAHLR